MPLIASSGSVVGFPSVSSAQSDGMDSPARRALLIFDFATLLVAISNIIGPFFAPGIATANGFVPSTFVFEFHGAIADGVLQNVMPIKPLSLAIFE